MIPKIINYCWFGKSPLPYYAKKCMKSWKKHCPDYIIKEWNEDNFDVGSCLFVKEAYESGEWAFVSDYARLRIVYENGGIYLDTDVEIYRPLDSLLKYDSFFALQQSGMMCNTGLGFGAKTGNELVKQMIDLYDRLSFNIDKKQELSCPVVNTEVIIRNGFTKNNEIQIIDNNVLLPPQYMDPIAPGSIKNLKFANSFSVHHYSASWTKWKNRRRVINCIGQERLLKIKKALINIGMWKESS